MVTIKFRHAAWAGPIVVDVDDVPRLHDVVSIEFDTFEPVRYLVSTVERQIDAVDRLHPDVPGPRRGRAGWVIVGLIDLDGEAHHEQTKTDE